jgi:hypothetical protein
MERMGTFFIFTPKSAEIISRGAMKNAWKCPKEVEEV